MPELTIRELETVLHALQMYRETMTPYNEPCTVGVCDHFSIVRSLDEEEIQDLCRKLGG